MKRRILIIDHDEDLLEEFKRSLVEEQYNVVTSNHLDMVSDLYELAPDLVILDAEMIGTGITGADICADIAKQYNNSPAPVLLFSGNTYNSKIAEYCGEDSFIAKPFDMQSNDTDQRYLQKKAI